MCFVSKDSKGCYVKTYDMFTLENFRHELFFVFLEQLLNCFALEFLYEL